MERSPHEDRLEPCRLRVMTYNVHACVGTDRRLDPARIAEVIAAYEPDVVALQELDVSRPRSGRSHQCNVIAEFAGMQGHFHPAWRISAEEEYGDAILSRWPFALKKAAELPTWNSPLAFEPRGALWITVEKEGRKIQVLNTHLGLSRGERLAQMDALMGPDWLGHADCQTPFLLCGDFNDIPPSKAYRKTVPRCREVQRCLPGHRAKATFPSRWPLIRLDYIFVSPEVNVLRVEVPRTPLTRAASDHLPLIADITFARDGFTTGSAGRNPAARTLFP